MKKNSLKRFVAYFLIWSMVFTTNSFFTLAEGINNETNQTEISKQIEQVDEEEKIEQDDKDEQIEQIE